MNAEQPKKTSTEPSQPAEAEIDQKRRDTLVRLGRYAAYTPPVVMTLLASRKALASSAAGDGAQGDPGPNY